MSRAFRTEPFRVMKIWDVPSGSANTVRVSRSRFSFLTALTCVRNTVSSRVFVFQMHETVTSDVFRNSQKVKGVSSWKSGKMGYCRRTQVKNKYSKFGKKCIKMQRLDHGAGDSPDPLTSFRRPLAVMIIYLIYCTVYTGVLNSGLGVMFTDVLSWSTSRVL